MLQGASTTPFMCVLTGPLGPSVIVMATKPFTVRGCQVVQLDSGIDGWWAGVAGGAPWQLPQNAGSVPVHTGRAGPWHQALPQVWLVFVIPLLGFLGRSSFDVDVAAGVAGAVVVTLFLGPIFYFTVCRSRLELDAQGARDQPGPLRRHRDLA